MHICHNHQQQQQQHRLPSVSTSAPAESVWMIYGTGCAGTHTHTHHGKNRLPYAVHQYQLCVNAFQHGLVRNPIANVELSDQGHWVQKNDGFEMGNPSCNCWIVLNGNLCLEKKAVKGTQTLDGWELYKVRCQSFLECSMIVMNINF